MLIIKKQLSIFYLFKLLACIYNFRDVRDRAQVLLNNLIQKKLLRSANLGHGSL